MSVGKLASAHHERDQEVFRPDWQDYGYTFLYGSILKGKMLYRKGVLKVSFRFPKLTC